MIYPVRCILLAGAISLALTHGTRDKVVEPGIIFTNTRAVEPADNTLVSSDTMQESFDEVKYNKYLAGVIPSKIQTLNPFFVSFAVSLILIAALLQLLNIFTFKKDIAWIVFLLILGGLVFAVISGNSYQDNSGGDFLINELEEKWAQWNLRTAFLAFILQVIHLFLSGFDKTVAGPSGRRVPVRYRTNKIIMTIIAILMFTSAWTVIYSGMKIINP